MLWKLLFFSLFLSTKAVDGVGKVSRYSFCHDGIANTSKGVVSFDSKVKNYLTCTLEINIGIKYSQIGVFFSIFSFPEQTNKTAIGDAANFGCKDYLEILVGGYAQFLACGRRSFNQNFFFNSSSITLVYISDAPELISSFQLHYWGSLCGNFKDLFSIDQLPLQTFYRSLDLLILACDYGYYFNDNYTGYAYCNETTFHWNINGRALVGSDLKAICVPFDSNLTSTSRIYPCRDLEFDNFNSTDENSTNLTSDYKIATGNAFTCSLKFVLHSPSEIDGHQSDSFTCSLRQPFEPICVKNDFPCPPDSKAFNYRRSTVDQIVTTYQCPPNYHQKISGKVHHVCNLHTDKFNISSTLCEPMNNVVMPVTHHTFVIENKTVDHGHGKKHHSSYSAGVIVGIIFAVLLLLVALVVAVYNIYKMKINTQFSRNQIPAVSYTTRSTQHLLLDPEDAWSSIDPSDQPVYGETTVPVLKIHNSTSSLNKIA